jgi:hypothetical protein
MATVSSTLGAKTATQARRKLGARMAVGTATFSCVVALVSGVLLVDGDLWPQPLATNALTRDTTLADGSAVLVETLLYDGTRPGFVISLPSDPTSTPDGSWAISDGTRPGLLP